MDSDGPVGGVEIEGKRLAVLLVHDSDEHEVITGVVKRSEGPTRFVLDWSQDHGPLPLPDDALDRITVLSADQRTHPNLVDCDLLSFLRVGVLPDGEPDDA